MIETLTFTSRKQLIMVVNTMKLQVPSIFHPPQTMRRDPKTTMGSGHTDGPDDRQKEEEKPEFVNIPISDVEEFVSRFVENIQELSGSMSMWAEKRFDIVNDERFVFEVEWIGGSVSILIQEKNFLHAVNQMNLHLLKLNFLLLLKFHLKLQEK